MLDRDQMVEEFVEIEPLDRECFLKVRETLTRIGIPDGDTLTQVCYVLHKRGRYFIVSGIELYRLDGRDLDFTDDDRAYRDAVLELLVQWEGLGVKPLDELRKGSEPPSRLRVIHHADKSKWKLVPNYVIGRKAQ